MNRFTTITPSAYTPQSFQELAFVPLIKRQKHDELEKALLNANVITDPLDVHRDEALRLKNDIEGRVGSLSEQLASQGITPEARSSFMKFNKEYQNLISPTGRIGEINQAKKLRDAERARFLESASKQYGSTRALELWDKHEKDYSGYQDPEKSKIKYIDSKGIVGAQNFDEDLKLYHSLLGETTNSASNSGYNIQDSGLGDGSMIMVNSSGQTVHSDNINQLNEQRKLLQKKWLENSGEGFKFNEESGIDLTNFNNRFDSAINMQKKSSDLSKYDVSGNFISGPKGSEDEDEVSSEGIAYDTKEVGAKVEDYDVLDNIGKPVGATIKNVEGSNFSPVDVGGNEVSTEIKSGKKDFSYKDIKDPLLRERYKATYDGLIERGVLKKEDRNPDKPGTAQLIKNMLKKQGPVTLSSKVIKSDMKLNSLGFPGELVSKDINQRSASVEADIQANTRQILDPETKREISWDKFLKKYPNANIKYYGYSSPHNWDDNKWGNSKQNVAANQVIVSYKDGDETKTFTTSVSRTDKELSTKDFKASETLNKTYKKATLTPGSFVQLQTNNPRLKGLKVKYNNSRNVLESYGVPVFELQIGNKIVTLPEQEYIEFIYNEYNK